MNKYMDKQAVNAANIHITHGSMTMLIWFDNEKEEKKIVFMTWGGEDGAEGDESWHVEGNTFMMLPLSSAPNYLMNSPHSNKLNEKQLVHVYYSQLYQSQKTNYNAAVQSKPWNKVKEIKLQLISQLSQSKCSSGVWKIARDRLCTGICWLCKSLLLICWMAGCSNFTTDLSQCYTVDYGLVEFYQCISSSVRSIHRTELCSWEDILFTRDILKLSACFHNFH